MERITTDQHNRPIFKSVQIRDTRQWDKRHKTPWEAVQEQNRRRRGKSKELRRNLRVQVYSKFIL